MSLAAIALALAAGCASQRKPDTPAADAVTDVPSARGPAPGQWQLVLEVDDLPGTGKVPPQTMSLCSTPDDKKHWQDMVGGKTMAGCTINDYVVSGPTISYTMQCAGGIEGRTTIRITDIDHYGGESSLTLTGGTARAVIRSRVTATRLAPVCKK